MVQDVLRRQDVLISIGTWESEKTVIPYGVPQGSILWSLLFNFNLKGTVGKFSKSTQWLVIAMQMTLSSI